MRATLVLLIGLAAFAASEIPSNENWPENRYPRFIEFPDGDGEMHLVDLEDEPDNRLLEEVRRSPANNLYLLYTRTNPQTAQTLVFNDERTVTSSNFNPSHPTVVVAHGWMSNQKSSLNPTIRDAYLRKGDNNVIILDWRRVAVSNYVTAVNGVPAVGRGLGQFLRFLNKTTGAPFSSMHLVGFSLGAHLVGNAGRELNGQVARVTGLDPAGPLWNLNRNRLRPSDGRYVEGIHTDGSLTGLGYGSSLGDVDFFPNGGNSQPGCYTTVCNHSRAWKFFAATVSYDHLSGRECANNIQIATDRCRGQSLSMGNSDLTKTGSGKYRVNTRRRYPYGRV